MILFASDYDGTLNRNGVSQEDIQAIHDLRSQGHLFGMATGRSLLSMRDEITKFDFPVDFVVGNNGGAIQNHREETLLLRMIPNAIIPSILSHLLTYDLYLYGANDGFKVGRNSFKPKPNFKPTLTGISADEIILNQRVAVMFASFVNPSDADKCVRELNEMFYGQVSCYSNNENIDIGPFGTSKKTGIDFIVDHLEIDPEIHVIGDAFNDVLMIEGFGGYTVENGSDEVKRIASKIFPSVADAIRHALDQEK